jgi:hypothetical protein
VSALSTATITEGAGGNVFDALPLERLPAIMERHGRPMTPACDVV